jgi:hypothetical protein
MAISEGAAHVQAIGGVDRQDGADVVVLGVDTHLDLNVGVALVHDQATSRGTERCS